MKKFLMSMGVIFLALIVLFVFRLFTFDRTNLDKIEWCKSLKLGMTKDQVKSLIGEPAGQNTQMTNELREYEGWWYETHSGDYTHVSVGFDNSSGRVIRFTCDDNYAVALNFQNLEDFGLKKLLDLDKEIASIEVGESRDEILNRFGKPEREYSENGNTTWQYPGLVTGSGAPTIIFHDVSAQVIRVQSGLEYFISEEDAIQFLGDSYSSY